MIKSSEQTFQLEDRTHCKSCIRYMYLKRDAGRIKMRGPDKQPPPLSDVDLSSFRLKDLVAAQIMYASPLPLAPLAPLASLAPLAPLANAPPIARALTRRRRFRNASSYANYRVAKADLLPVTFKFLAKRLGQAALGDVVRHRATKLAASTDFESNKMVRELEYLLMVNVSARQRNGGINRTGNARGKGQHGSLAPG